IQKAADEGAAGIHVNGDAAEGVLNEGKFEKVGEMVELIKSKKRVAGVGAHPPRAAFPYAFNNGADFILVGMFDWQIEEDVKLARRVYAAATSPDSKRTRPWYGAAPVTGAGG